MYLSGQRDRAWFDVEEARCNAEIAEAGAALDRLPAPPDEQAIRERVAFVCEIAQSFAAIETPAARANVLRGLGMAVVDARGVTVEYRPEWAMLFDMVVLT